MRRMLRAVITPYKFYTLPTAARGAWRATIWLVNAPQRQIEATLAERQEQLYKSYLQRQLATS